jgi:ParB family transcriptional regulator, chromosome partitioning protein
MPRQTKSTPAAPSSIVKQVLIADVVVSEHRKRGLRNLADLKASITALGLLQPIVVTRKNHLVAGLHRLRACEALGWKTIPATVVDLADLRMELAEIDENLCRSELTVLERSEQYVRRKVIYESLYPETRAGHAGATAKQAKAQGESDSANEKISFAESTARAAGMSVRSVEMDTQIAVSLSPTVRDLLRHSPVADRKGDLLGLVRLADPARQLAIAKVIAGGQAATLADAEAVLAEPTPPKPESTSKSESESAAPAPEPAYDQLGHPITDPGIAEAFAVIHERTAEVLRHLRAARNAWRHFDEEQHAAGRVHVYGSVRADVYHSLRNELEDRLPFLIHCVKSESPFGLCPYCGGAPWTENWAEKCEGCGGVGWVGRFTYRGAPPEMRAALDARGMGPQGASADDPESAAEAAEIAPPDSQDSLRDLERARDLAWSRQVGAMNERWRAATASDEASDQGTDPV